MLLYDVDYLLDLLRLECDPLFGKDSADILRVSGEEVRDFQGNGIADDVDLLDLVDDGVGLFEGDTADRLGMCDWRRLSYPLISASASRSSLTWASVTYCSDMSIHPFQLTFLTRCSGRATTILVLLPSLTLTS